MTKFIFLMLLGIMVAFVDISAIPNIARSWPLILVPIIFALILNTRTKNGLPFLIGVGLIFDVYSNYRFGLWLGIFLIDYWLLVLLKQYFSDLNLSFVLFSTVFTYLIIETINWQFLGQTVLILPIVSSVLLEIIMAILVWSAFIKYSIQPKKISLLERRI